MKPKRDPKSKIIREFIENKKALEAKLDKILKKDDSRYYSRRLKWIYEIIQERCIMEGKKPEVLAGADFYQKIELFMNYDKDIYNDMEVYDFIAEVFKSYYVNFILAFLEGEKFVPLPYLGQIKMREFERYSHMHKRMVNSFFGTVKLDPRVKRELKKINKGLKTDIIKDTLDETERILTEKSE